jgi:hypothetical protein
MDATICHKRRRRPENGEKNHRFFHINEKELLLILRDILLQQVVHKKWSKSLAKGF